jgi:hypothetical protein
MKKILVLTGVLLATAAAFSDEAPFVSPTPGVDVVLGVRSFPRETDSSSTFQTLVLRPHLTWDDWYIQLDLPLNYQIVDSDGFSVSLREADWVPTGKRTYLDVYLPRIALIQFGEPGADVFFQVGAINELTLGNGFVVDRYSNTLFAPGHTQTGANISLRGPLFGLPSGGFDAIIGNLAALDVIAGRVHWALFEFSGHPLFSTMEVGTTLAADRDPWYLATRNPAENNPFVDGAPPGNKPDDAATTWGIDVKIPVVRSPEFQAAVYGDYIVQNQRSGSMLGVEASFAERLLLRGEAQLVQDGVVPRYFGALYDSRRPEIYRVWNGEIAKPGGFGWLGGAGLVSRDNRFAIHTSVAGHPGGGDDDTAQQVHASFQYHGTIEIEARYDTFGVTSLADFANLKNTRVGVHAAIRSEAVAVALSYNVVHDPLQPGDPWAVFAGLETRISY